jgi:hypothetical protein
MTGTGEIFTSKSVERGSFKLSSGNFCKTPVSESETILQSIRKACTRMLWTVN